MSGIARILALASAVFFLEGCCADRPITPDFSTPEATLLTFHRAFQQEDTALEYECFSLPFKQARGNLNLTSYYDLRRRLVEEYPLATLLFSMQNLENQILRRFAPEGSDRAALVLSLGGEEVTVEFLRETIYRLEFDEGTPFEDFSPSLQELTRVEKNLLAVFLPLSARAKKKLFNLRKILVEMRWKFLDFSFLKDPALATS